MEKKKSSSSLTTPKDSELSGVVVDPLSSVPAIQRKGKHFLKTLQSVFYITKVLFLLCLISNWMLIESTNITGIPVKKLNSTCNSYYCLG